MKIIISLILCGIAGGLGAYFGGLGGIVAVIIAQVGMSIQD